jgi:hypothetical protein
MSNELPTRQQAWELLCEWTRSVEQVTNLLHAFLRRNLHVERTANPPTSVGIVM